MNAYLQEIEYQKKMLRNLLQWIRNAMIISSIGVLIVFFAKGNPIFRITGVLIASVSLIACVIIGIAVYRGRKNIEMIVSELEHA